VRVSRGHEQTQSPRGCRLPGSDNRDLGVHFDEGGDQHCRDSYGPVEKEGRGNRQEKRLEIQRVATGGVRAVGHEHRLLAASDVQRRPEA
jgi:hypothetical protein